MPLILNDVGGVGLLANGQGKFSIPDNLLISGKDLSRCPTMEEYKTVVGGDIINAVDEYFDYMKKVLKSKEYSRKQYKSFERLVACNLLTVLTYHAFNVGWEWGKNEK